MATTSTIANHNDKATIKIPELYLAAVEGNGDKEFPKPLHSLVNLNGNTILHIHLINPSEIKSIQFVRKVLQECPSLLLQVNDNGDTPLHIAARYGHSQVVEELLQQANSLPDKDLENGVVPSGRGKMLLEMKNNKNDTALHEAAQNGHLGVVKLLVEQYPDVEYCGNDLGETPLYIAALKGYEEIAVQILNSCKAVAYRGPNGRTALHAAAMGQNLGVVTAITNSRVTWAEEVDEHGWTPLHYAANGDLIWTASGISKMLMESDRCAIYAGDKARKRIPLHIAACRGNCLIMALMSLACPDCYEMIDSRGWNVAHYAVASKYVDAIKVILENSPFVYLMNVKDVKGNTPMHLLLASYPDDNHRLRIDDWILYKDGDIRNVAKQPENLDPPPIRNNIHLTSLQKKEILEWMQDLGDGPLGQIVVTRDWDVPKEEIERKQQILESVEESSAYKSPFGERDQASELERTKDSHLVVAALVATVSFAAGFTLPGGFKGDKDDTNRGTAILSKNTAFQAFVVTDAIAMLLSITAVFTHFLLALGGYRKKYNKFIRLAFWLIMASIGAMVVAFITGLYAVLAHSSALAIITCLIGLTFFFFAFLIFGGMVVQ